MRTAALIVAIVAIACLSTGCRTVAVGATQEITISTTPAGATVEIRGPIAPTPTTEISGGTAYIRPVEEWRALGKTPIRTKLRRGMNYDVKITMPGYDPVEYRMERSLTAGFWLGNLFVPIIGHIMDLASGAAYNLTNTNQDNVALRESR